MSEKLLSPARHEPEDVGHPFIWMGTALVVGLVVLMAWLALWLFPHSLTDRTIRMPLPQYPSPRLQVSERADMERFYAEEMRRLNGTGWMDRSRGVVHIPISDAMHRVARDGIAGWPAKKEKPP